MCGGKIMATNPAALQAIYSRELRKRRRKLGLCIRCKEPAKSALLCEKHLQEKRDRTNKSRAKRRKQGLCVYCGGKRPCGCQSCKPAKYTSLKNRAKSRHIEFTMTKSEFEKWLSSTAKVCTYCGVSVEQLALSRCSKKSMTIDRMNNDIGYKIDNICLACHRCNNSKSNFFTFEQWKKIADEYIKPRLNEYHTIE
jgi:hypothetical protein